MPDKGEKSFELSSGDCFPAAAHRSCSVTIRTPTLLPPHTVHRASSVSPWRIAIRAASCQSPPCPARVCLLEASSPRLYNTFAARKGLDSEPGQPITNIYGHTLPDPGLRKRVKCVLTVHFGQDTAGDAHIITISLARLARARPSKDDRIASHPFRRLELC